MRRLMMRMLILMSLFGLSAYAVDVPSTQVPVEITHEKGSFNGQLSVSMNGSLNKAKVEWNSTIRNTATHRIFRAAFCVKAFDDADQQIKPGGNECVLTLWGSNWEPGVPLTFKGKQNIKITEEKTPVKVAKYTACRHRSFRPLTQPSASGRALSSRVVVLASSIRR